MVFLLRTACRIARVRPVVRTDAVLFVCLAVMRARPVMRRAGSVRDAPRIVMGVSVALTDVGQVVETVWLTQAVSMECASAISSTATGPVASPARFATPEAAAVPTARVETAVRTDVEGPVCRVAVRARPATQVDNA